MNFLHLVNTVGVVVIVPMVGVILKTVLEIERKVNGHEERIAKLERRYGTQS